MDKPQYSLILKNATASFDFFRLADASSNEYEAVLWSRMNDQTGHIINNAAQAKQILLENPKAVFLAQDLLVKLTFKEYPCQIVCTSKALFSVKFSSSLFV